MIETAAREGGLAVAHGQWCAGRPQKNPGNQIYLTSRTNKETYHVIAKARRDLAYVDLFHDRKIVAEGKKPLEPTEQLKKLRADYGAAARPASIPTASFEILKVLPDLTCSVPDAALIPFKIDDATRKRLADIKSEFGVKSKRQRIGAQGDVFPKTIEGDIPAGLSKVGTWPIELRVAGSGPGLAKQFDVVQLKKGRWSHWYFPSQRQ